MTQIKRADILALKNQAEKLRDEIIKEYRDYKAAKEKLEIVFSDAELEREECKRFCVAENAIKSLRELQSSLEYLGVLI